MSPNVIAYIIIIYLNKNVYVFRCLLGHARLRFLLPISTIENAIMMMNIWRNHLTLHLQHLIHDALRTTKTLYRTHSKCGWNEIEIVGGFQSADLCATFTSNRSDKKQAIDCPHQPINICRSNRKSVQIILLQSWDNLTFVQDHPRVNSSNQRYPKNSALIRSSQHGGDDQRGFDNSVWGSETRNQWIAQKGE